MSTKTMRVRIVADASDFSKKMEKAGVSAESAGKRVKKALSMSDISAEASKIMGWGGSAPSGIKTVNGDNVNEAKAQLQTLQSYRDMLSGVGFGENTTDPQYGAISERIMELTYDIRAYEAELQRQADAQRGAGQAAQSASMEMVSAANAAAAAQRDEAAAADDVAGSTRRTTQPVRTLGQWLSSIGSHTQGIRRTSEQIDGLGRRSKSTDVSIGRMVSSLRQVALVSAAFRIAGAAVGRLRSIVSEYINDNATLQAQVNGLKSGLGQALAPAINLVTNAMSALMPYVLGVSNAIGQLLGTLFGSGWTAAANGAEKTAAATGGAAKAQKEMNRQLMSFDQINKMSDNSSAGSGGGGGAGTDIAQIESKTPAWMERFKTSFSDLFASDEFSAANIGGKIGMVLQRGLDWIGSEGTTFDWSGAGETLRKNYDSFMESGWEDSAWNTGGILLGGLSDAVIGWFTPDWEGIKKAYNEGGMSSALQYVGGISDSLTFNPIEYLFESVLPPVFSGLATYFEEKGNDGIASFFNGLANFVSDPGTWLKENLADPLVRGVENLPTVFRETGQDLLRELTGGIEDGLSWVQEKLDALKEKVSGAAETLKNAFSFDWKMPDLKLPHLQVNWDPVDNVVAQFFGVNAIPRLSVSWFAKGGILDGAQIFGRIGSTLLGGGERGREAILPLDSNTGWMDDLARRITSQTDANGGTVNATIYITLDGKVLTSYVIKDLRNRSRAGTVNLGGN